MLGFLNSTFLVGLIGVSLPILIHLFARQRKKKILFSSTALLSELQIKQVRKFRFAQVLILILRCLAVGFLVLAFARPTLKTGSLAKTGDSPVSAILMIDRSLSMQRGRLFAEAQSRALDVLDLMKSHDEAAALWSDDSPDEEIGYHQSHISIRDHLIHSTPGFDRSRWPELLPHAIMNLAETSRLSREIYWIWDMQKTSVSMLKDSVSNSDRPVSIFILPVSGEDNNTAIVDGGLLSQIIDPATPIHVFAEVKNYGSQAVENLWIRVNLQGESVAQKTVSLDAGEQARIEFSIRVNQTGWIGGQIEIEDDVLSADNRYDFAFHVPDRLRVRLIGHHARDLHYPAMAFRALSKTNTVMDVESMTEDASWTSGLNADHVLIFCNYPQFSIDEADRLDDHIRQGGGAFFLLGPDVDLKHYADRLMPPLFNGSYQDATGSSETETYWHVETADWQHFLLDGVFQIDDPGLVLPKVYKRSMFTQNIWSPILSFEDGVPFLAEAEIGKGRILLCSTGLDADWSDLAVQSLFTPLMYRSAAYLSSQNQSSSRDFGINDAITEVVHTGNASGAYSVIRPDQEVDEIVPTMRDNTAILEYSDTDIPGLYRFQTGNQILSMRAVYLDPEESDCRLLSPSDLNDLIPGFPITVIPANKNIAEIVKQTRSGREIWREMLMIAIALLLAEIILARWFLRRASRNETQ